MTTQTESTAPAPGGTPAKPAERGYGRVLSGIVKSNKMDKTIVVAVVRRYRHPIYKKFVTKTTTYKAHDEQNSANPGDTVQIVECRPLSREKRWRLKSIVERAA